MQGTGQILTPPPLSNPISQAVVNVYKIVSDSTRTIVASTTSNSTGQFLFPYLVDGDYVIEATKANYITQESAQITLANSEMALLNLILTPLAIATLGTVSGFISYSGTGVGIPNAVVALYKVVGNIETLVQQTRRYLFGNVPDGNYLVKSFTQTNAPTV